MTSELGFFRSVAHLIAAANKLHLRPLARRCRLTKSFIIQRHKHYGYNLSFFTFSTFDSSSSSFGISELEINVVYTLGQRAVDYWLSDFSSNSGGTLEAAKHHHSLLTKTASTCVGMVYATSQTTLKRERRIAASGVLCFEY